MSDGTKADDIALALEEAIVSGEIPPGSTLRQEHLSEQFQVSRTPVREALRRLAALGLVTFEPNRGVRVRMLSLDEIREAFMVRAELESLATEIATLKMTDVAFDLPRSISKDVAIINGSWMVHGLKPEPVRVRSTMILRRDPEGWRYVAARFMAALPS